MTPAPWLAASLLLIGGCASERVVLLPDEDGNTTGAVAVLDPDGAGAATLVIDQPNTEVRIGGLLPGGTSQVAARDVEARYGDLLRELPAPPAVFVLYYLEGTTTLTPESRPVLDEVLAEIQARGAGGSIQVTGHTDRFGRGPDNDRLSIRRARSVARALGPKLGEVGVTADRVVVAGRGEREPRVPTADGVREPKNRRVEITVR